MFTRCNPNTTRTRSANRTLLSCEALEDRVNPDGPGAGGDPNQPTAGPTAAGTTPATRTRGRRGVHRQYGAGRR